MKQDTNIGTNILRVSASDEDADNNGAIVYNLTAYNSHDLEYFTILPESGWIVLTKPLDVSQPFFFCSILFFCMFMYCIIYNEYLFNLIYQKKKTNKNDVTTQKSIGKRT